MTTGSPWKKIVMFAIPILLGSLLQQLYNAVDAIIVGQFVNSTALGAVGSTGSIVQLLIALFVGLSSGTCVVVANYYGKKDHENLNKAVHTGVVLTFFVGVVMSVVGVILSPYILQLMNTDPEMLPDATAYLQIFFAGMTGLAVYNIGASILQAVGNSRYPLYLLLATTLLNVVGDLVLIVGFKMGVAGAAIATIIAQFVSAVLVLAMLMRTKKEYKLSFKKLKIDKSIAKTIIAIGVPGALQQSIVSISNIMVQTYINGLGAGAIKGYAATQKIDAFLPLPISATALAITTFVSQNLGAGKEERARKGAWQALWTGLGCTAFLSVLCLLFNSQVLGAFSSDSVVLENGLRFSRVIVPFYIFLAVPQIMSGALRGAGKVNFATITCIACYVALRQIYLAIVKPLEYSILTVALCYPVTWIVCTGIILVYYLKRNRITGEGLTRIHLVHTDGMNMDFIELCKKLDEFQNENVPGRREAGLSSLYNSENLKDIFLLYDGSDVVGSAGLWRHDDETCEVVRLYVDKNYRNQNYVKMIINEVQQLAKTLGYKQLNVRTFNSIQPEMDIYEQIGFAPIEPGEFKYIDRYSPALQLAPLRVYMRCDLQ